MNRCSAIIVASLVSWGLGASTPLGAQALAGEATCDRLQSELAERDREVAQHRDYSRQLFKQTETARTALEAAERAAARAEERANAAALRARSEIAEAGATRNQEIATRSKELEEARAQIVSLRAEVAKQRAASGAHEEQLASLRSQSTKLDAALRSQVSTLEATLRETIAQRDDQVAKREAISQQWKQQVDRLTAQVGESEKQNSALGQQQKQLDSARAQIASLMGETTELRAALVERDARLGQQAKAREAIDAKGTVNDSHAAVTATKPASHPATEPVASVALANEPGPEIFDPAKPFALAKGTIKKWQQPDGSLFFGERPQPGSRLLGQVAGMGTSGGSQVN